MLDQALIDKQINDQFDKNLNSLDYKIVVLDDDPTGTQTVKDLPVYTEWTEESLEDAFKQSNNMFYILTNSRALNDTETTELHKTISESVQTVSNKLDKPYLIISRGDSTLRGHFYLEPKVLSDAADQPFDAVFYLPAFFEGDRYTYEGTHYLKEGNDYIPVADSEFANDTTFGFKSTTMADFIEEKSNGDIKADDVYHVTLEQLRNRDQQAIFDIFDALQDLDAVVVDALNDEDMDYFTACLTAYLKAHDKKFIFRSAASFVKSICTTPGEIINLKDYKKNDNGGVIIVGSHVKKSSSQLSHLIEHADIQPIEFDVKQVTKTTLDTYIQEVKQQVEQHISDGEDVVVYTSRDVIKTDDLKHNLNISTQISNSLVRIIKLLNIRPNFIIAKGGITSSDVATKGLNIKKAEVIGQITKGVPVWLTGDEAKYDHMPYVIFPGNVGEVETLTEVYQLNS
ncbi:four-carbon acid sugar kinase family protein [Staphylococcus auricularis]|uniref:four-carbon acid sugar kinase family protein n=1 Tax=Staphylococcus auricularis TaxID=29379 RepID=UPI003F794159